MEIIEKKQILTEILEKAKKSLLFKGYLDIPLEKNIDFLDEIARLKKEKNAVILAHWYQTKEIQDLADFLGDSLQLARAAKNTNAEMIVFCGVHFMAEAAKILNPEKKVVLPDLLAGCSLADSCTGEGLREFKKKFKNPYVISYINCDASVKAESDIICTSSNAEMVVKSVPEDKTIIFAPDKNLGAYLIKKTGRKMELWDGACYVHEAFSLERITQQLMENPKAKLIAHPESQAPILDVAHFIGSTSALLDYVVKDNSMSFIVATEEGILHEMRKRVPNKKLIPALPEDKTCACSECMYMKRNTLKKIYLAMEYELPEITIDEDLRLNALKPIEKMLDISQSIK